MSGAHRRVRLVADLSVKADELNVIAEPARKAEKHVNENPIADRCISLRALTRYADIASHVTIATRYVKELGALRMPDVTRSPER